MQGRAFECPICRAAFTNLDLLIRHEFTCASTDHAPSAADGSPSDGES